MTPPRAVTPALKVPRFESRKREHTAVMGTGGGGQGAMTLRTARDAAGDKRGTTRGRPDVARRTTHPHPTPPHPTPPHLHRNQHREAAHARTRPDRVRRSARRSACNGHGGCPGGGRGGGASQFDGREFARLLVVGLADGVQQRQAQAVSAGPVPHAQDDLPRQELLHQPPARADAGPDLSHHVQGLRATQGVARGSDAEHRGRGDGMGTAGAWNHSDTRDPGAAFRGGGEGVHPPPPLGWC